MTGWTRTPDLLAALRAQIGLQLREWHGCCSIGRMRRKALLPLIAALVNCRFAQASCSLSRPFCESLPDRSNTRVAIFLGVVKARLAPPPAGPPRSASFGEAPRNRGRAGDPIVESPRRYPVVRLQVLEAFSGAEPGEIIVH